MEVQILKKKQGLSKTVVKIITPIIIFGLIVFGVLTYTNDTASAHCDSVDGPVVLAAKEALKKGNVNYVLPYVYQDGEDEIKEAFQKAMEARKGSSKVTQDVIDYWFYETVVRVHRIGEGANYTGLKDAGLDYGPAIPAAEMAIKTKSVNKVKELILNTVEEEIDKRFDELMELPISNEDVNVARERVEGELLFQKYIHQLYTDAIALMEHGEDSHGDAEPTEHTH